MAKLKGKKKAAFLARMKKGRLAKAAKKATRKVKKAIVKRRKSSKKSGSQQTIKTTKRKTKSVAKGKTRRRIESGFGKITKNKFVRGAVLGLGGAALVVQVTDRFAPQFSQFAAPIGAFVFGGPVGLVASVLLQGGFGLFGAGGSVNEVNGMKQQV